MLKTLAIALLVTSASLLAEAQSSTSTQEAPDLSIIKFNWSKERIGWQRDPFGGPLENFDEMRARARNEKRIDDSKRGGGADVDRIRREAQTDAAITQKARNQGPARYRFLYKVSVMNTGKKTMKEIDCDYVFFDAATGQELGRREFTGVEKIAPGKSKELSFLIPTAPTQTISVYALDKKERERFTERLVIVRILYEDGSVWQRPN